AKFSGRPVDHGETGAVPERRLSIAAALALGAARVDAHASLVARGDPAGWGPGNGLARASGRSSFASAVARLVRRCPTAGDAGAADQPLPLRPHDGPHDAGRLGLSAKPAG